MFWFKKKNKDETEIIVDDEIEDGTSDTLDVDDEVEIVSEDEILDSFDDTEDFNGDVEEDKKSSDDIPEIVKTITSVDMLTDFVNKKSVGGIQYMRKSGNEAFEIRDSHLRIAGIWGSVSMAKEYKPSEYAKIMLALEILENPDDFYILPALTEEEREKAIMDFCSDKYGINGKKYAKNTLKFAKLVKSSGDYDEWLAYTKIAVMSKVDTFCKENGIIFESVTEEDINER